MAFGFFLKYLSNLHLGMFTLPLRPQESYRDVEICQKTMSKFSSSCCYLQQYCCKNCNALISGVFLERIQYQIIQEIKKNKYKKGLCIQLWYLFLLVLIYIYLTFLFILLVYFEKQLYLGFISTKKHILFSISGKFQSKETLPKLC